MALLGRVVRDTDGHRVGDLADGVITFHQRRRPVLTGLVLSLMRSRMYVPWSAVEVIELDRVVLSSDVLELFRVELATTEVLVKGDLLRHRLIDVEAAGLVKAFEVGFTGTPDGWILTGLDVHKTAWSQFGARHGTHPMRDWDEFVPLWDPGSVAAADRLVRLRGVGPERLARVLDGCRPKERARLLALLRADPRLETGVLERARKRHR
ncbi:hypothetical protein KIH31_14850 [Paenarthrobacter sp. DKR-5]|uniref:hypothetical protein n=1 Tax=Paenarthrobacter sp. DKR-5 TaxID=2835535 RepID=UPI001BDD7C9B|nr:hypothetical protein [Paenarthrobacter sp. DKR-5]MBT1003875.1 hypothetical protein [Paenarthrobacter sp. DKR-5]